MNKEVVSARGLAYDPACGNGEKVSHHCSAPPPGGTTACLPRLQRGRMNLKRSGHRVEGLNGWDEGFRPLDHLVAGGVPPDNTREIHIAVGLPAMRLCYFVLRREWMEVSTRRRGMGETSYLTTCCDLKNGVSNGCLYVYALQRRLN